MLVYAIAIAGPAWMAILFAALSGRADMLAGPDNNDLRTRSRLALE